MDNLLREHSTYEDVIIHLKNKAKVDEKWIDQKGIHV